jgi:hypothetical protein
LRPDWFGLGWPARAGFGGQFKPQFLWDIFSGRVDVFSCLTMAGRRSEHRAHEFGFFGHLIPGCYESWIRSIELRPACMRKTVLGERASPSSRHPCQDRCVWRCPRAMPAGGPWGTPGGWEGCAEAAHWRTVGCAISHTRCAGRGRRWILGVARLEFWPQTEAIRRFGAVGTASAYHPLGVQATA